MGVQSKTKELFHYYEIPFPRDTIGTKPEIKIENQKITLILSCISFALIYAMAS